MSQIRFSGLVSQRHVPLDSFSKVRGTGWSGWSGRWRCWCSAEFFMGDVHWRAGNAHSSRNVTGPPSLGGSERSEQGVVLPLHVGMVEPPPVQNPCQLNCGPTARARSALYMIGSRREPYPSRSPRSPRWPRPPRFKSHRRIQSALLEYQFYFINLCISRLISPAIICLAFQSPWIPSMASSLGITS